MAHVSHRERAIATSVTCTSCGCLCDDIELHTEHGRIVRADRACRLGREWFFGHHDDNRPSALVDGRPAAMEDAVDAAVSILTQADHPLIYGLGNSTCEAQRAAVLLAEDIGGVIVERERAGDADGGRLREGLRLVTEDVTG